MSNAAAIREAALQLLLARAFAHFAVDSGEPGTFLAGEMDAMAAHVDALRFEPEPVDSAEIKAAMRDVIDRVLAGSRAFAVPEEAHKLPLQLKRDLPPEPPE